MSTRGPTVRNVVARNAAGRLVLAHWTGDLPALRAVEEDLAPGGVLWPVPASDLIAALAGLGGLLMRQLGPFEAAAIRKQLLVDQLLLADEPEPDE